MRSPNRKASFTPAEGGFSMVISKFTFIKNLHKMMTSSDEKRILIADSQENLGLLRSFDSQSPAAVTKTN
jgi:hypothetical protein